MTGDVAATAAALTAMPSAGLGLFVALVDRGAHPILVGSVSRLVLGAAIAMALAS